MLLEIGAVHFNPRSRSPWPRPALADLYRLPQADLLSAHPLDADGFPAVTVMREAGFEAFDNIAGGETAGIPFAALVAERMALPMTYVRKKPKGYGRNARIEGDMGEGAARAAGRGPDHRWRLEALFVDAIRETGATCGHTAVIFYYGILFLARGESDT
jgi:orotate phosphoribosyltransferase